MSYPEPCRLAPSQQLARNKGPLMTVVGDITLSTASDPEMVDHCFENQLLDISPVTRSGRIGRDGRLYVTCCPRTIIWYRGRAAFLRDMVHVKVICAGSIVVDDDIANEKPQVIAGGIRFVVKSAETA
jgi:hypothetical protein